MNTFRVMARPVLRISRSEIRFLPAGDQEEKNDNVLRMWIGDEVRGRSWLGYDWGGGGYRYCGILTPTVGQGPLHSRGHIRCHLISIPSTTFLSVTVILRSSSCLLVCFLCLLPPDRLSLVSTTATALCSYPFLRQSFLLTILCPYSLRIISFLSNSSDRS